MEELKKLMEMGERMRAVVGLYEAEKDRAERYRAALVRIMDTAGRVAEVAREAISCG